MSNYRLTLSLIFLCFLCLQFVPARTFAASVSRERLDAHIAFYENGEYQKAVDGLKALLPSLTEKREVAEAYQYLAYSYVLLDMIDQAKSNFSVLLRKFPNIEIDTISVPPNITIVYKQVKLENQLEKQKDDEQENKVRQSQHSKKSRVILGVTTGVIGVGSGALSALFYMESQNAHGDYKAALEVDKIQQYKKEVNGDLLISRVSLASAGVFLAISAYQWFSKPDAGKTVSMGRVNDKWVVCYRF